MTTRSSYWSRDPGSLGGLGPEAPTLTSIASHIHSGGASRRLHLSTAPRSTPVSAATPRIVPPDLSALRTARQSAIVYFPLPIAPHPSSGCNDH
jgi:hypothetical protein